MIPYRDDVLISEQIVQDLVNQFNNLTQEEKESRRSQACIQHQRYSGTS